MIEETIDFIKSTFNTNEFIPLHGPVYWGQTKGLPV